ncbi:hypothetical protein KI688_001780 [Linnemannia hyalina]|uniref:Uncharacterized protein n=1 Tax=Linnemannia hyalina TaxID=64524 RepID=A0A9P7XR03_9FUNG|nr:hypothetical protein KI688_001780 [Linnemannia hyalina]
MPEFCKQFGFTREHDAHAAFSSLLSTNPLSQSSRDILWIEANILQAGFSRPQGDLKESYAQSSTASDALLDAETPADEFEHDQDTELHRSAGTAAGSKRRRAILEGGQQEREQPRQKRKGQQQQQRWLRKKEEDLSPQCFFDAATIVLPGLEIEGIDVGKPFKRPQEEAAAVINDVNRAMTLYQLSFQAGIYLWQNVHTSYLPKDHYDIGKAMASVELLKTFKIKLSLKVNR